jgi:hypothetical protein
MIQFIKRLIREKEILMNRTETLHRLTPRTMNACIESHVLLSPPHVENGKEYSVFKIFQNTDDGIYATDDDGDGVTVMLSNVYTEIEELLPIFEHDLQHRRELCKIRIIKAMKYLPAVVSLVRLERFPNEILFKDYEELTSN